MIFFCQSKTRTRYKCQKHRLNHKYHSESHTHMISANATHKRSCQFCNDRLCFLRIYYNIQGVPFHTQPILTISSSSSAGDASILMLIANIHIRNNIFITVIKSNGTPCTLFYRYRLFRIFH